MTEREGAPVAPTERVSRAATSSSDPTAEASWLLHGAERCEGCEQLYAYEVEVRCVDCDRAMCPFCVVTVRGEATCGACDDGEEAS